MAKKRNSVQPKLSFNVDERLWDPSGVVHTSIPDPYFRSSLGVLYEGDCVSILPHLRSESVDTVFADPPFNLGKQYGSKGDDNRPEHEYLEWCQAWVTECVRILKPGGTMFVYNLPKWNIPIGGMLNELGMTFRHWIAVNIKMRLPIKGRLYPAHYSLLYYCKGPRPKTFRNIRTPIQLCRHCGKEVKDYGGHRGAMNPKGVNLSDVWDDIPPVRHRKFKSTNGKQISFRLSWSGAQLKWRQLRAMWS